MTSLTVTWSAPANAGPAITDYDVQYREGTGGSWSDGGHTGAATTATLSGLSENTSYQVQVRATNDEGTGDVVGLGHRHDGRQRGADVQLFGDVRRGGEPDGVPARCWRRTATRATTSRGYDDHRRGGPGVLPGSSRRRGIWSSEMAPNFEDAKDQGTDNTYVVTVQATSGTGERVKTATQTITVTVTDVAGEAPGKPDAPDGGGRRR